MRFPCGVRGTCATVLVLSACHGPEGPPASETTTSSATFCERVLPRVEAFMARMEEEHPVPDDPRYGGTVVVSAGVEIPGGMNAFTADSDEAFQHQLNVNLMSLLRYGPDLELEPYLAESWEVSADTTAVTFHLRDDVYWHDGERTDAYDVAFTYERATDPETRYRNAAHWQHYVPGPEGVEVLDSLTVTVHIARPHAEPLNPWQAVAVMPEHLLADVPAGELGGHPFGTVCPVGNGPFVFLEHRPNESWTFGANPAFPEGLGGRPFVDRYVFRRIPEPATLLAELLTEGTDVYLGPPLEHLDQIVGEPHLDTLSFPSRGYDFIAWNQRRPMLADARVRMALSMALDRQGIVEAILGGHGRIAHSTVPPFHWAYDIAPEGAVVYDPDEARRLLEEAGWTDGDGDGIREDSAGDPLRIQLDYALGSQRRSQTAEVAKAQLREVGVDLVLNVFGYTTLVDRVTDTVSRDYDAFLLGWANDFKLGDADLFHSERIGQPLAFAGVRNPELDLLIDTLDLISNRAEARPLWHRYQELLIAEQPYTFLYFPDRLVGYNRRLRDLRMDVRGYLVNLGDWWIDPAGR